MAIRTRKISARDWIADPKSDLTLVKHFSDGRIISVRRRMREDGGYVVTHEDITERHRLEQNEREAREVLSAVFDAAPAAIICLDLDGRVMVWSRGAERLFGYAAAEVVGGPYPLVPEGKEEEFKQLFQRALDGETFRDVHVQRRSKDGRLLEVNFASSAMLDNDGTVRGIAYALTDITESEKLRKRFKEQHEQLDAALNNMSQGLAMFDAEQRLIVCNKLYAEMYGLTRGAGEARHDLAPDPRHTAWPTASTTCRTPARRSAGPAASRASGRGPGLADGRIISVVAPQDGQRRPRRHARGHHGARAAQCQARAAASAAEGAGGEAEGAEPAARCRAQQHGAGPRHVRCRPAAGDLQSPLRRDVWPDAATR